VLAWPPRCKFLTFTAKYSERMSATHPGPSAQAWPTGATVHPLRFGVQELSAFAITLKAMVLKNGWDAGNSNGALAA